MIERYPLEKAADAYAQMISGRARFRVVLTMGAYQWAPRADSEIQPTFSSANVQSIFPPNRSV